jgi:hypothetical protein
VDDDAEDLALGDAEMDVSVVFRAPSARGAAWHNESSKVIKRETKANLSSIKKANLWMFLSE